MTDWAALVWLPEEVQVLTEHTAFSLPAVIAPAERFGLRLTADERGWLYLRIAGGRQPFWLSRDHGETFTPMPPIPDGDRPIPVHDCKVHRRAGLVSALEGERVWFGLANGEWQPRALPPDIQVRDVSIDAQGGLWCVGSVRSQRIPDEETEAAVRFQAVPATPFEARSPRLSPSAAAKLIANGGLAELRTINAEREPPVATSICSWLLEDSSSFVFIFLPERTYSRRLRGEMVCHVDRPQSGLVRVFTHQGGIWQGRGPSLRRSSIAQAIKQALASARQPVLIRGLDASAEKMVVAVEVSPPGVSDFVQDPEFTALCMSLNGGASFDLIHRRTFDREGEIQDVAWLN